MEFNKPVSNPIIIGTIELMKANEAEQKMVKHVQTEEENKRLQNKATQLRKAFWAEFMKSEFLAPVLITPPPVEGDNGSMKIEPGSNVQFPSLRASDGSKFLMAFTDKTEFNKFAPDEKKYSFALTFDDYVSMLLHKGENEKTNDLKGIVVNPFGGNIVILKDEIAKLILLREE